LFWYYESQQSPAETAAAALDCITNAAHAKVADQPGQYRDFL
jgi:hypothetical protein